MLGYSNAMQQPSHDLRAFQTSPASPRRFFSIGAVIVLHLIVIWALATGLAANMAAKLVADVQVAVVQQPPPKQSLPPPPPPQLVKPPPPFVPPPQINVVNEPAPTTAITAVSTPPPVVKAVPKPVVTQPASIGRPHVCPQQRWYPPIAVRLGHQGTTTLAFRIGTDGSVKDVTVAKSSGYDELDQAAKECALDWHYKPAEQGGSPVEVPWEANVKWQLNGY
jgi:periplasmic protein TonB